MDRKLYLLIEETERSRDESIAYSDAIVTLSTNPVAASALANEMRKADRDEARADFLREYFSKH